MEETEGEGARRCLLRWLLGDPTVEGADARAPRGYQAGDCVLRAPRRSDGQLSVVQGGRARGRGGGAEDTRLVQPLHAARREGSVEARAARRAAVRVAAEEGGAALHGKEHLRGRSAAARRPGAGRGACTPWGSAVRFVRLVRGAGRGVSD
jgi:hypothetical protein